MRTKLKIPVVIAGVLSSYVFNFAPLAAQPVAIRSNYMGGDWSGSWSNEANWAAVTPYPFEPGDSLGGEIEQISMAHDNSYLYIFFDEGSEFAFDAGSQNIYFDTDLNPATGDTNDFWWWGQSMGGVGAEHSMYGWAIWHHGDTMWTGDTVDNSVSNAGNHLIQINRSKLGDPSSFDWVGRMFGIDDYYPDIGSHHRYDGALPTVSAFGRDWTTAENAHPNNSSIFAEVSGAPNSLTLTGVFGYDTSAMTPLTVEVGTKVSYDFALTHDFIDPIGDGLSAWVGDAWGAFLSSADNPSNSNLLSIRVGVVPGADEAARIQYNDISLGELGHAPLVDDVGQIVHHLADGVHIEWLFTSENTAEISVFSADGNTLLGPVYVDEIGISNIRGLRFNLWDSEQTMTITNFTVTTGVPGDFNGDGSVDAADYVSWRKAGGSQSEYNQWRTNFGTTASGSGTAGDPATTSGAVPEPASLALCGLALAVWAAGRRRPVTAASPPRASNLSARWLEPDRTE